MNHVCDTVTAHFNDHIVKDDVARNHIIHAVLEPQSRGLTKDAKPRLQHPESALHLLPNGLMSLCERILTSVCGLNVCRNESAPCWIDPIEKVVRLGKCLPTNLVPGARRGIIEKPVK
jgi:hypothetical protein